MLQSFKLQLTEHETERVLTIFVSTQTVTACSVGSDGYHLLVFVVVCTRLYLCNFRAKKTIS